ncbi:hypothetical protein [Paraglaciecola sp.]|uniref:hypothetical protein n=1 Tax=Paraglaciecola sp. TaxID=1920173 RepID=UPI003263E97A
MAEWLYTANVKFYDVLSALIEDNAAWPISSKVNVGDIVYIYLTAPHKKIGFVSKVTQINLPDSMVSTLTSPYLKPLEPQKKPNKSFMLLGNIQSFLECSNDSLSLEYLKSNGLKGMLMGPRKLDNNPELLKHIRGAIHGL